ncbi:MAG: DUF4956 domain-containing protein [Bacteroidota bacterium]|nr:DUF4956 domain-containing protein [Bacteroidota bacterium]MDP3145202.1 DUF4956 domain-containing protein [Bacteroidota bacterium]MDP3557273.1 DUF4956 domain-containing protein [Bacteroidota bacterium]
MMHQLTILQISEDVINTGFDALQKISGKLLFRLLIDIVSIFILIRFVYFPVYKKREFYFTFFVFNLVIFLLGFLLNKVDLSLGAAFGLFAVFSMLRYRTENISIKDMTYLFLVIAIGLINAITKIKGAEDSYEYLFLGLINILIISFAFLLDSKLLFKKEGVQTIVYEKIELVNTLNQSLLIEDIKKRTGLNVYRISIIKIDFLNDSAQIKVYFTED